MTASRESIDSIQRKHNVREGVARQALEVSDGDMFVANSIIQAARTFRRLHEFEGFVDNIEQLVRQGDVSIEEAIELVYEYDGSVLSAKAELDVHEDGTDEAAKRFRESIRGIREEYSPSGTDVESGDSGVTDDAYSPGTFVVPNNKHYLQKLEARARDGQASLVETVYALTGQSYTHPTDLIPLDDERFYSISTRRSTSYDLREMVAAVVRSYSGSTPPKVIAKFHTHPSGIPSPSEADQSGARRIYEEFVTAFDTDDFEFFHGIHGLTRHGHSVAPSQRHQPRITNDQLVWDDETFRHRIAVYGPDFETQKPIRLAEEG